MATGEGIDMEPCAIDSVLFDLDGTLVDSVELILNSYQHVHREHLQDVGVAGDHYRSKLGVPLLQIYQELVEDEVRAAQLVEAYKKHNRTLHDGMVRCYPGVKQMLHQLDESGVALAIVTSKGREVALRGLRICEIDRFFATIVALENVEHHKPDPQPVERAVELLGTTAERTLFVGDAPTDIAAGRAAGVLTGAALWGPFPRDSMQQHPPDFWFESPLEIPAIVARSAIGIRD